MALVPAVCPLSSSSPRSVPENVKRFACGLLAGKCNWHVRFFASFDRDFYALLAKRFLLYLTTLLPSWEVSQAYGPSLVCYGVIRMFLDMSSRHGQCHTSLLRPAKIAIFSFILIPAQGFLSGVYD